MSEISVAASGRINSLRKASYNGREFMSSEPAGALSGASPQSPSEDNPTTLTDELELPENDTGESPEDLTEEVPIMRRAAAFAQIFALKRNSRGWTAR
jgi:hypothetical protein